MVQIIQCNIKPIPNQKPEGIWRFPCGEVSIISIPTGVKLVWLPLRHGTFSEAVVSVCMGENYNDLKNLITNLNSFQGVEMYHVNLIPIGEDNARFSLDITAEHWPAFSAAVLRTGHEQ